jgi:hypothetical protein
MRILQPNIKINFGYKILAEGIKRAQKLSGANKLRRGKAPRYSGRQIKIA